MLASERLNRLGHMPFADADRYTHATYSVAGDMQRFKVDELFDMYAEQGDSLRDSLSFFTTADEIAEILTPGDASREPADRQGYLALLGGLEVGALIARHTYVDLITAGEVLQGVKLPKFTDRTRNVAATNLLGSQGLSLMGDEAEQVIIGLESEMPRVQNPSRAHSFRIGVGFAALSAHGIHVRANHIEGRADIKRAESRSIKTAGESWNTALFALRDEIANPSKSDSDLLE